jgi:hypothetical protein
MQVTKVSIVLVTIATAFALAANCIAQPPRGGRGPGGPGRGGTNAATTSEKFIAKWLTMDENSDGQLSTEEMKDYRLKHLFKTSDKNSDGILTQLEMKLLFEASSKSRASGQAMR